MSKLRSDELVNMEGDGAPSFPQGATSIEPTANNQVATKSYVDSAVSASLGNSVSDTAPANPAAGSFWTDTSVSPRVLKTWDGSSWIEFAGAAPAFTGLTVPPVEVLTPLNGAGLNDGESFTPLSSVITAVGEAGTISKNTDEILSVVDETATGNKVLSFPTNTNFSELSVGDVVQSEYATWDSTTEGGVQSSTFSADNTTVTLSSSATTHVKSSIAFPTSGKWYVELTVNSFDYLMYGVIADSNDTNYPSYLHQKTESYVHYANHADYFIGTNSGTVTGTIPAVSAGDVLGILLDLDNQELRFSINGIVHGGFNSVTNTVPLAVAISDHDTGGTASVTLNAGQSPWAHEPPSGYLGLTNRTTITAIDATAPSQQQADVYATFDPDNGGFQNGGTLSSDNLTLSSGNNQYIERKSTLPVFVSNIYCELTLTSGTSHIGGLGIGDSSARVIAGNGSYITYRESGDIVSYPGNVNVASGLATWASGDVIGMTVDNTNVTYYKNGTLVGTYAHGKSGAFFVHAALFPNGNVTHTINFGATAFSYTPPTGYTGLSETVTTYTYPTVTVDGGTWDSSNQSQFWTGNFSCTSNGNLFRADSEAYLAFDGDETTAATSVNGATPTIFVLDLGQDYPVGTIVEAAVSWSNDTVNMKLNDTSNFSSYIDSQDVSTGSSYIAQHNITSSGSFRYIQWERPSNAHALYFVKINGKMLVDAVDDSQVWSGNVSVTNGVELRSGSIAKMFSPVVSNSESNFSYYESNSSASTLTFDPPITSTNGNVHMYISAYQAGDGQGVQINGSPYTLSGVHGTGSDPKLFDLGTQSLSTISWTAPGGTNLRLNNPVVDGKLLIDTGTRDFGDTKISSSIPYEKSLTFADTTEFTRLISPLSMTDANGDVISPVSDVIANVNGNILTLASDTNLTYFRPGDEVQPGVQVISVDATVPSITVGGGNWLGADGSGSTYEISKSLRFNQSESASLSKTFSSAGNRRTWTWSGWVKLSSLTGEVNIFNGGTSSSNDFTIKLRDGSLWVQEYSGYWAWRLRTDGYRMFRDPSTWDSLVVAFDSTQTTSTDRIKVYINGIQQTTFSVSTYPNQNFESLVNTTNPHYFGYSPAYNYSSFYLADVYFVDGQALAPTAFGEVNGNNIWQPKAFSGTYGTNGFHLDFSDSSSDAALGYDAAGSNDWTVNNLTARSTWNQDYVWSDYWDAPMSSSSGRLNGFNGDTPSRSYADGTFSTWTSPVTLTVNTQLRIRSHTYTPGLAEDKKVFEVNGTNYYNLLPAYSSGTVPWVVIPETTLTSIKISGYGNGYEGSVLGGIEIDGVELVDQGIIDSQAVNIDSLVDTPTNYGDDTGAGGEVRGNYCTLNPLHHLHAATLANGNLQTTSSEKAFSTFLLKTGKWYVEHTVTTAYYNLCFSQIDHPSGATPSSTNSKSIGWYIANGYVYWGAGYSGDLGGTTMTGLDSSGYMSNAAVGDIIAAAIDMDNSTIKFYKNGSEVGSIDFSTGTAHRFTEGMYVSQFSGTGHWNFGQRAFAYAAPSGYKALCDTNLPSATIKDGSKHFDVVTYTGNGSTQTISGLEFSPDLVWLKSRSSALNHRLVDSVQGVTSTLSSNLTYAKHDSSSEFTALTNDGFSVTQGNSFVLNNSSTDYVAWCWDAGDTTETIAAGSLGNYNTDRIWSDNLSVASGSFDQAVTNAFNGNNSNKARTSGDAVLVTLNFSPALTVTSSVELIADFYDQGDFQYTATIDGYTTTQNVTGANPAIFGSGSLTQLTVQNNAPGRSSLMYVKVDGATLVNSNVTPPTIPSIASEVRANPAAGFSIVKFSMGSGSFTVGHNLNAEPHLLITKSTSNTSSWWTYHKSIGVGSYLNLSSTAAAAGDYSWVTAPTSSVFTANNNFFTNGYDYIVYCFAPVEGYSAMGSYIGNGSADGPFVYTGFKPSWIMIKSTDGAEHWRIVDSTRDPINPADAEIYANTNSGESDSDLLDILSNGFKIRVNYSGSNSNGHEYVYMAFAEHPVNTVIESTSGGDTQVSLDPLAAAVTEIIESDGATMYVNGATGPWRTGLYAAGPTTTFAAPSPAEIEFTSMNQSTTPYTGAAATLASRTWTLESSNTSTGPWTLVDTYVDYDVLASQDGATPWITSKPTLSPNTFYRVKVAYNATNADTVESTYHTFKTGNP